MPFKLDFSLLPYKHQTFEKFKFINDFFFFEIYVQEPSVNLGYLQRKLRIPLLSVIKPHKHLVQRGFLNTYDKI